MPDHAVPSHDEPRHGTPRHAGACHGIARHGTTGRVLVLHVKQTKDDAWGHNGLGYIYFHGAAVQERDFHLAFKHFNLSAVPPRIVNSQNVI